MSGGSVAFNYSHLGSVYASAARSYRMQKKEKSLFWRIYGAGEGGEFFFSPRRLSYSFSMCSYSLYISFSMPVVLNYDITPF